MKDLLKHPLFRFFSSLKMAVISILLLAAVLAYGTICESLYGMRGSHLLVYGTYWFAGVVGLLGSTVFCAALSRYPWKRHQTGFLITHAGILVMILGSFITQQFGVDGNLPVQEGESEATVILNELRLRVHEEGSEHPPQEFPVPEAALKREGNLMEVGYSPTEKLVVDEFLPRVMEDRKVIKSGLPGVGTPAAQIEISNSRFNVTEWIVARHPERGGSLNLGPAVISLVPLWSEAAAKDFLKAPQKNTQTNKSLGTLYMTYDGHEYPISISRYLGKWGPIGSTRLQLEVEKYLPYAVVENNQLVNRSDEPVNPAVTLKVKFEKEEERHTVFANFPEFATLHRRQMPKGTKELGLKFRMVAGGREGAVEGGKQGKLSIASTPDGKLLYRSIGREGDLKASGPVKVGAKTATGWMDLQFEVKDFIANGVETSEPRYVEELQGENANFQSSMHLTPWVNGAKQPGFWLTEGETQTVDVGGHHLYVTLGKSQMNLPFHIALEKFTVGMDPGTSKAASYESRVRVKDPSRAVDGGTSVISMNEPLKHGRYTLYQASYQMQEGKPPISIFSVNFDPGRWVKYAGALSIVLGILTMFYMNPHYWDIILGKRKAGV